MKASNFNSAGNPARSQAFTFTELLVVMAVLVLLSGILLATPGHANEKSQVLADLHNLRQILAAMSMYQTDNRDYLPHPTWGSVDGTASAGPDGWAYAVKNNNRLPGLPHYIPSATGYGRNSMQYSNQVQFFKIGQLGPFLPGVPVMQCPKDVAQSEADIFGAWFKSRPVKVTSYTMTCAVGGYSPTDKGLNGRTYQATEFRPPDIILWEQNETDGFFFNDAGSNPETLGEGLTQRHYGTGPYSGMVNGSGGGGVIGRLGGAAEFMRMDQFLALAKPGGPRPNDLLNGPGYR